MPSLSLASLGALAQQSLSHAQWRCPVTTAIGWRNDKSFSQRTVSFKGPTAGVALLCLLVPCVLVSVCFGCISVWHAVLRIPREISFGQTLRYADVSEQIQVSSGGNEWGESGVYRAGRTWWHSNLFRQAVMLHNCHEIWNNLSCIDAIASPSRYFRCFQWHPSLIVRRSGAEAFALNSTSVVLWLSQITPVNHNTRLAFQHHEP